MMKWELVSREEFKDQEYAILTHKAEIATGTLYRVMTIVYIAAQHSLSCVTPANEYPETISVALQFVPL